MSLSFQSSKPTLCILQGITGFLKILSYISYDLTFGCLLYWQNCKKCNGKTATEQCNLLRQDSSGFPISKVELVPEAKGARQDMSGRSTVPVRAVSLVSKVHCEMIQNSAPKPALGVK